MKTQSGVFIRGFVFTAAVLFVLNIASYALLRLRIPKPGSGHMFFDGEAGFPIPFYEFSTGSYFGIDRFILSNLVLDGILLLIAAVAVGALCAKLSERLR